MLQFKEYIINRNKKKSIENDPYRKKGDYIIKSDKPLIFKKKKIKKVSDLLEKGNFVKKEEEDFSLENEDLSEKFFEKYFQFKIDPESPNKNKITQSSPQKNKMQMSNNNPLSQSNKGQTAKNESIISLFQEEKKNQRNPINSELDDKNNFTQSIYQKVLNEERLEKLKKKKQFRSYISTVYITQCQLETLEGIHTSLEKLLPIIKIDVQVPKKILEDDLERVYFIQKLNLSENKLTSIHKDITYLPNLKILDLSNNLISDINKVKELQNIKKLIFLTFRGNKICLIRGYRQFIIELCPLLTHLDNAEVSEKELEIIHFKGSRFGEKRLNGHGKVIKYPNPFKYLNKKK
jgi:Leucine-rich repeat (LRR) protein